MQGKSKKQYEDNAKIFLMAVAGMFLLLISLIIWDQFQGQENLYSVVENIVEPNF